MILYERPEMKEDFDQRLHPEVKDVVWGLETVLEPFGQMVHITEVCRSNADSERIYTEVAKRLLDSKGNGLHGIDLAQFQAIQFLSPVGLRNWCRSRPSWHKPWAAVDLGFSQLSHEAIQRVIDYLAWKCRSPMWEIITEPHGTGPHGHIARRDYGWLKEFPGSLRDALGRKNPSPGT